MRKILIPFELSYNPMKLLAIINFEKNPDRVYKGLELQYFDDQIYGKGYRVIAYRVDGYVDVYDDVSLKKIENENFDVAGKGLCEHIKVEINHARFCFIDRCVQISFEFTDKYERPIYVDISEQTTKKTTGFNLLAPIGSTAEKPSYLPLFFLYDFDFIRKNKSKVVITIGGNQLKQDNFPVPIPKDFQWRYYSRYTPNCQIIEFANAKRCKITEKIPDSSGIIDQGPFQYQYCDGILQRIVLKNTSHPVYVEFGLGLPDIRAMGDVEEFVDTFLIRTDPVMGHISGQYSIKKDADLVRIEMIPSGGWTPVPNSLLTKMLFGKNSVFCKWPKTYRYIQSINMATLDSVSSWERIK